MARQAKRRDDRNSGPDLSQPFADIELFRRLDLDMIGVRPSLNKAHGRELGLSRGANVVMPNLTSTD